MKKMYFDFRDVFRTPRLALSGKKIWVHFLGLLAGWIIYSVLTYLALLLNGQTLSEIWQTHYFFPCLLNAYLPIAWYAWLLSGLGLLSWIIIFMYASTAVSRITYKQLKGDDFFSSGDSYQYAKKHGRASLLGPLSILLIMAFFIVMAIIAAWICKWPVLDILFLGFPYLLYFIVSTFVVYTIFVFCTSLLIAPAIVATAEEDTMETVFQSYSTLWSQPWRLVTYESVVGILMLVASYIYGLALLLGFKLINFVFGAGWLMGDKSSRIINQASSFIIGEHSPLTPIVCENTPFIFSANSSLSVTETITAILVTIALLVITGSVLAYLLSNFSVGQTLIYIILRKKKDEENLLERKDEDELAEEETDSVKVSPDETFVSSEEEKPESNANDDVSKEPAK
jgi:hypothetical protein